MTRFTENYFGKNRFRSSQVPGCDEDRKSDPREASPGWDR